MQNTSGLTPSREGNDSFSRGVTLQVRDPGKHFRPLALIFPQKGQTLFRNRPLSAAVIFLNPLSVFGVAAGVRRVYHCVRDLRRSAQWR